MVSSGRHNTASLYLLGLALSVAADSFAPADEVSLPAGVVLRLGSHNEIPPDGKPGRRRDTRTAHRGAVLSVAVSPDGKTIATGGVDGAIRLWTTEWGIAGHRITASGPVRSLAWLPDGKTLLAADVEGVRAWDPATGLERFTIPGEGTMSLAVGPDGSGFVAGGVGVRVYRSDGKLLATLLSTGRVVGVAIGPGGGVAVKRREVEERGTDRRIRQHGLIDLWGAHASAAPVAWDEEDNAIAAVALLRDGWVLAEGGAAGVVRLRDPQFGRVWAHLKGEPGESVTALAASPDGRVLASGFATISQPLFMPLFLDVLSSRSYVKGRVVLWQADSGKELMQVRTGEPGVRSVAFFPDGRRLAAGLTDGTTLVYDWKPPEPEVKRIDGLLPCWKQMGAPAPEGIQAALELSALPGATSFLKEQLGDVASRASGVDRLLASLRNGDAKQREAAAAELRAMADLLEPALRAALEKNRSDAASLKLKIILLDLSLAKQMPERLRTRRGLLILERLQTKEARTALESLARTEGVPLLSREAKAAVDRLAAQDLSKDK